MTDSSGAGRPVAGPPDRDGGGWLLGPLLQPFAALLFDLDGVLTRTAIVHAKAWQELFDGYLRRQAAGEDGRRFHESFDVYEAEVS